MNVCVSLEPGALGQLGERGPGLLAKVCPFQKLESAPSVVSEHQRNHEEGGRGTAASLCIMLRLVQRPPGKLHNDLAGN